MARTKKQKRSTLDPRASPELGNGDFAVDYNSKGRAIRRCRKQARESPFEDSAIAITDSEDDESEEVVEVDDVISVAPMRKRKRSLSPELHISTDPADTLSGSEDASGAEEDLPPSPQSEVAGHMTVHLTVNIPLGHQGPITLELDPKKFSSAPPSAFTKRDKVTQNSLDRLHVRSKPKNKKRAGFLDLPAELRNEIYCMIFVTERDINFSVPDNFSRSSALLRICRQVHEEGRSILYSENRFVIERRNQRYGSLWEHEWRELGYLNVRRFMKSIGQTNTALLRHLTMMLEDAVPCLNPSMRTNEERRFVHDDDLISVLRHLGSHSQLQTLRLHFHGRRRVERTDDRFLDYMKRIKADTTEFVDWPPGSTYPRQSKQDHNVTTMLEKSCTRRRKKFDSKWDAPRTRIPNTKW